MFQVQPNHRLHAGFAHQLSRYWQESDVELDPRKLMLPVFITDAEEAIKDIEALPGVKQYGLSRLTGFLDPLVAKGLKSVLLIGVLIRNPKDENGSFADGESSPVVGAIRLIRAKYPNLYIACDVCLCAYTSHGHCGIINSGGVIDNAASVRRMAVQAVVYARAGAHAVAPSSMMDGVVGAIKRELASAKLDGRVAILSCAVKYASGCFYEPLKMACQSEPAFGTREGYQLMLGTRGLAARAVKRDVDEGADFLMIKPGLPCLDIVEQVKQDHPHHPLFVYQASGEYAMLYHAAGQKAFDLKTAVLETFKCMQRAGASVIISYFIPSILLEWDKK